MRRLFFTRWSGSPWNESTITARFYHSSPAPDFREDYSEHTVKYIGDYDPHLTAINQLNDALEFPMKIESISYAGSGPDHTLIWEVKGKLSND